MATVYWDANVFLSYLTNSGDRTEPLRRLLAQSADPADSLTIMTSVLTVAEVVFAADSLARDVPQTDAYAAIDSLWADSGAISLHAIQRATAEQARDLIRDGLPRGWRLKPADALHLATAMEYGAEAFSTYDQSLWKYAALAGMPVAAPGQER